MAFESEPKDVFVHGFHNALGKARDGAKIDDDEDTVKDCVLECIDDVYPVMTQPFALIVGVNCATMAAAYPDAVMGGDGRDIYRVFMNVGRCVVWVRFVRDSVVTCSKQECGNKSPNAYILRAGYRNVCLGCGDPIVGADVLASVLHAYVLDQLKGGIGFERVMWPAGFAEAIGGNQMLNVGEDNCEPYDGGFLASGQEKTARGVTGDIIMRCIHLFMSWLHIGGRVVVKSDTQDIVGVAQDKINQYPSKAGSRGATTGTELHWKADDGGFYYSLVMMRVKAPDAAEAAT